VSAAAKVGALVLVGLGLAAWFVLHIESEAVDGARGKHYRVEMADAQGLIDKSPVFIRGVRVGRVVKLRLSGDRVVGEVLLRPEVVLHEGAAASVSSVGLLGQKQLVISPGQEGSPELPEDTVLQGSLAMSLDEVLQKMGEIGQDVKDITGSVRASVASPESAEEVRHILRGASGAVAQVERALAANQDELRATVRSVERFARATAGVVTRLDALLASTAGPGTGGSGGEFTSLVSRLNATAGNLEDITGRVQRGEGPVGQLLSAEGGDLGAGVRSLQDGVGQLSGALTALEQTRVSLGLRGDWLAGRGQAKGFLQLQVQPQGNAFLRLEAVGEPFGLQSEHRADDGTLVRSYQAPLAFSAQLGARLLPPLAVRAGLTESRLGAGVDAYALEDRLRLSVDAWDFGRGQLQPHLRLEAAFTLYRPLYVVAGWDDPLNTGRGLGSAWVGAGLWLDLLSPEEPTSAPAQGGGVRPSR
jgi:phospholipid/cholesterol/gamma-HCH transport system substrate-binding protein